MIIGNAISPFSLPKVTSITYDPVSVDYFTRAGVTDVTEMNAVNAFYVSCKSNAAILASLQGGAVYLVSPTSYGASMHNLISSSFQLSSSGADPAYSTLEWHFLGAEYLKTGFIPSVNGTINNSGWDCYLRSFNNATGFFYGSVNTAGTNAYAFNIRGATDLFTAHCYNNSTGAFTISNPNSIGTFSYNIRSNTDKELRFNGASVGTSVSAAAGAQPPFETFLGCRNVNGTPLNFAVFRISTFIQRTAGLSSSNTDILRGFIDTYNANVIPGGR